jgi:hypothetical protein
MMNVDFLIKCSTMVPEQLLSRKRGLEVHLEIIIIETSPHLPYPFRFISVAEFVKWRETKKIEKKIKKPKKNQAPSSS